MDEIDSTDKLQAASLRVDKALKRLEETVNSFGEQAKVISKLQSDVVRLNLQKSELASNFEHSLKKQQKLDKAASEVSLELIGAIKTIKSVLVK